MYNGTAATNSDNYGLARIRVVQNSINTTNNTSNVTIYYEAQVKNMTSFPSNLIMDLRVGHQANFGRTDYWNISNIRDVSAATKITKNNTWYTLYTWTGDVSHNTAGVCALSVVFYFNAMDDQYHQTVPSCYGVATLENTYKATTPTATFTTQANALNMGSAGTITLPRNASALTHKLVFKFGSTTQTLTSNAGASYSWTPAIATYASQIPRATTGSGTLTCTTYNGSTQIGTATTITIWLAVPSSVVPTATVTTSDPKGYLTKYGGYVKGKSQLQVQVAGAGIQGSTIASYQATYDNTTQTGANTTFSLNVAGSRTVTGKVTDSRGRSGTKTASVTVHDYVSPKITRIYADRCREDGTDDASGEYAKVIIDADVASLNGKNSKKTQFRYKPSTSDQWSSWNNSGTIFAADADYAYDVQAQVIDDFTTVSETTQIPGTFVLVDYGGMQGVEGTGLAFGGAATKANTFLNYLATENYSTLTMIDRSKGYTGINFNTTSATNQAWIKVYDLGDVYGNNMLIESGGNMLLGGGEYPAKRYNLGDLNTQEHLYLGSDARVFIETNGDVIANRKTWTFGSDGTLTAPSHIFARYSTFDLSKADNGVTNAQYPTTFSIHDSANRITTRMEGIVQSNGNVSSSWYVRNYDTSGTQVGQKGIRMLMDKTGALTYTVNDPDKFRSALGFTLNTTAPAFTNAANFELTNMTARKYGQIVQMTFQVKTTNALTANTNYTVATITPTGYRPAIEAEVINRAEGALFRGYISTAGSIVLRPNAAVTADSILYCWAIFIAGTF